MTDPHFFVPAEPTCQECGQTIVGHLVPCGGAWSGKWPGWGSCRLPLLHDGPHEVDTFSGVYRITDDGSELIEPGGPGLLPLPPWEIEGNVYVDRKS